MNSCGILKAVLAFYYVELPERKARIEALNAKLKAAGQKPLLS